MYYPTKALLLIATLLFALNATANTTVSAVADSPQTVRPLLNGMTAPAVTLLDQQGKEVQLLTELGKKPTVLVFYRGGWCPYCNAQLAALRDIEPKLQALGYQLIAISPQAPKAVAQSQQITKGAALNYSLLSDQPLHVARAFGLAYYLDDKTTALYKGSYGIELTYDNTGKAVLPVPAVYILNSKAEVQFSYVHINYKTRLEPELLLLAAKLAASR
ncbi:peroxiredoxin-like family protein [Rheinheimera sp. 4Y26]|uniref:peroxiredoxin-like family protein n=1 Tax=Rheinheimera sp. 4Y26 TaxID=2977811 RepID=UPI0021B0D9EC|nr:peroxiredoxin-like family protein [Rheinheimera sp. 4Y26]MCT6701175.1 AhpC/TSA family protein [Rheinheimera sp. 4Y26]